MSLTAQMNICEQRPQNDYNLGMNSQTNPARKFLPPINWRIYTSCLLAKLPTWDFSQVPYFTDETRAEYSAAANCKIFTVQLQESLKFPTCQLKGKYQFPCSMRAPDATFNALLVLFQAGFRGVWSGVTAGIKEELRIVENYREIRQKKCILLTIRLDKLTKNVV